MDRLLVQVGDNGMATIRDDVEHRNPEGVTPTLTWHPTGLDVHKSGPGWSSFTKRGRMVQMRRTDDVLAVKAE